MRIPLSCAFLLVANHMSGCAAESKMICLGHKDEFSCHTRYEAINLRNELDEQYTDDEDIRSHEVSIHRMTFPEKFVVAANWRHEDDASSCDKSFEKTR